MHKIKDFNGLRVYWYKAPIWSTAKQKLAESVSSKSIKLFQSNGPSEVINGILESLNVESKKPKTIAKFNWAVSSNLEELFRNWELHELEVPTLLGPNIEFERYLPEIESLRRKYILVPALWVQPVVQSRLNIPIELIKIWASGVDTDYWKSGKNKRQNILIYRKHDETDDLFLVCNFLRKHNIPFKIFEYGRYRQRAFKKYLSKSIAGVWLAGSESQGMALLQAWSMDVPTLVRRKDNYLDKTSSIIYPASSAPYLTVTTGIFTETESITENDLERFLECLPSFRPREYVVQNFTLENKIQDIYQLLSELSS
jgi:hypothetical protein